MCALDGPCDCVRLCSFLIENHYFYLIQTQFCVCITLHRSKPQKNSKFNTSSHWMCPYRALKTKNGHNARFVVNGGTVGCHEDNLLCYYVNSWFPVSVLQEVYSERLKGIPYLKHSHSDNPHRTGYHPHIKLPSQSFCADFRVQCIYQSGRSPKVVALFLLQTLVAI